MNQQTIESALVAWVRAVTGLSAQQVYLSHQGQHADNAANRISITVGDIPTQGQPELRQSFDDTQPRGEEINLEQLSMAQVPVAFQCYGPIVVGTASPRAILQSLRASLNLNKYREPLRAAGLGPNVPGAVRWLPEIAGAKFEGRAVFEVLFSSSESAEEKVGYIQTVKIRVKVDDDDEIEAIAQLSDAVVSYMGGDPTQDQVVTMPAPTSEMEVDVSGAMFIDKGIITPPVTHDDPQLYTFSRQDLIDDGAYLWATALQAALGDHTVEWVDTNDQVQKSTLVAAAGGVVVDSIDYATIETATPFGANLGVWRVDVYAPGGGTPYLTQPFVLTA